MKIDFAEVPDPGGRYDLGEILGCGVFGKVHLATDTQASLKRVAIKIQKCDADGAQFIEEEYKILRDTNTHVNLIDFYGIYRKDNDIWLVLELCEGGPVIDLVNSLLARNRRMAEEHIAYILKEVTKAVIYLHDNCVIHRDIKGSNILLTREGEVKLCDFNLSQSLNQKDEKLSARLGSPCWMAPGLVIANQQKSEANYDTKIDVWALGITAIELGEGKAPFQDFHPTRALFQIVTNPPPALQKLSNWSEYYHDFISECLVKCFEYRPCILEVIEHPFLKQIPENNYHLSLEIKSLLEDTNKVNPSKRHVEVIVKENNLKKGVDGELEPMYEEDLAALQSVSENNVLETLERRLQLGECYSFIGDILLYLNPNEKRSIYGKEFHQKYSSKSRSENAPHIYAVGDTAYQNAVHHVVPQQIIFLGESSSGKTTNYLHLLNHLLYLGKNINISTDRIVNSVKLIHSLIHASTPANEYSTRAIFKTNISYGKTGKFTAASFSVLGLEKWRITSPDINHGNFHFLYYVHDGLVSEDLADRYKLNSNKDYRYLRHNDNPKTQPEYKTEKNINKFHKILKYMDELQFSNDDISTIYYIASAILNLGEVRFTENEDGYAELHNKDAMTNFADLLEVDGKKISWALTNYCVVHAGNAVRKRNTCEEARDSRDVLANTLYMRLVDFVVSIINKNLALGKEIFGEKYCIKILDYPGFECFKQNYLPQFFVNCFNEQLHYHFVQRVFAWELMDLTNEEVKYIPIRYFNNKDTLNEILGKPEGVLSIIDDSSKKGFNGRYVIGNIQSLERTKVTVTNSLEFAVSHYTGTVSYTVRDMPEKNRDFLSPEIIETMRSSKNSAVSMFFTNKLNKCGNLIIPLEQAKKNRYDYAENEAKKSDNNQFSQVKKMRTQATIFRAMCLDLLKELSVGSGSGGTHFVKCIRTDLKKRPLNMQNELVKQQLRALSVVETAKARRRGYPHRISFPEFLRRYKFLAFDFEENVELTRDNCRLLMVRLKMEGWALGKTKIFLKYYNEEYLSRLYETQVKKIIKIQSILRGFLAKCKLAKENKEQEKECIKEMQQSRKNSMTEDEAAEIIQKAYRKTAKRKENFDRLEEDVKNFIKPFASKWKNKSLFSVLLRYRAVKLQDLFNFSQQVHFYNIGVFYNSQIIMNKVNLKAVDRKATVATWLGEHTMSVIKLTFRLNDIPFYDTSYMCDFLTNLGNIDRPDSWDVPYHWRESQSNPQSIKYNRKLQEKTTKSEKFINMTYTRNPEDELVVLPRCIDEDIEDDVKHIKEMQNENVKGNQTPDSADLRSDETDDSMDTDLNTSEFEKRNIRDNKNIPENSPRIEKIHLRKVDKSRNNTKYIVNSKPANKDFDYIKAAPVSIKSRPHVDPIAELRNITRKDSNASDDDPPFNFQGMLRKTNFRRDSMKNTVEMATNDSLKKSVNYGRRDSLKNAMAAVRKFSLGKDQDTYIFINGNDYDQSAKCKNVELEILPGLIMNGVEIDL